MEIIPLSGYTEDEKSEIAKGHLIPKQIKNHALKKGEFKINDAALLEMIRTYTREAGVRNLEREIAKLARKAVTEIVKGKIKAGRGYTRQAGRFPGGQTLPLWPG